jgi:hypothetical protein
MALTVMCAAPRAVDAGSARYIRIYHIADSPTSIINLDEVMPYGALVVEDLPRAGLSAFFVSPTRSVSASTSACLCVSVCLWLCLRLVSSSDSLSESVTLGQTPHHHTNLFI